MTGAELQTLREAAGLSREVLAGLADVQARTVKHWESRASSAVPADVAVMVRTSAAWVLKTARDNLRDILLQIHGGPMAAGVAEAMTGIFPAGADAPQVVLVRYRETDHMRPQDRELGHLHGAMLARLVLDLIAHGMRPRVVWFDPVDYDRWFDSTVKTGGLISHARWAAQAIASQTRPHAADQPPAGHTPGA